MKIRGKLETIDGFGAMMVKIRERLEMTQLQMGRIAKLSQATYSNIESGMPVSRLSVAKIANSLGTMPEDLLSGHFLNTISQTHALSKPSPLLYLASLDEIASELARRGFVLNFNVTRK